MQVYLGTSTNEKEIPKRHIHEINGSHNLGHLLVAVRLAGPLAGTPLSLVVLHGLELVTVVGVVECTLQSTLSTLTNAPPGKCSNQETSGSGSTAVDTDVGAFAQVGPFLGQGFGGLLLDFLLCGGVSTIEMLAICIQH